LIFQLRLIFLVLTAIAVFSPGRAYGQIAFTVEPDIGILYGHTTYTISGSDYFSGIGYTDWSSKLEWPINNTMAGLGLHITNNKKIDIDLSVRASLDTDSGKMKDSDYISTVRAIYSESDTDAEIFELDINAKLYTTREKTYLIDILGGFKYQTLSFRASNLVQESISGDYDAVVNGLVGTYDVDYYIPSVGVRFRSIEGRKIAWHVAALIGYVTVRDVDDHVLRYKESTGKSTGASFTLNADTRYDISKNTFISLSGEFTYIYAEGKQKQVWYETTDEAVKGTTYTGIPLEIESSQAMINLGIGFRF